MASRDEFCAVPVADSDIYLHSEHVSELPVLLKGSS